MVTIKEFDKIVEETWEEDFSEETELYRDLSKNLKKSPYFQQFIIGS